MSVQVTMIRKSDARASSARAVVGHRLALLSPIVTALGTNVSSIEISLVYSQTWGTNRQHHELSSRAVRRSGANEGALWTLHIRGNVTRLEPTAAHHSSRFVIKDSLSIGGIQTPVPRCALCSGLPSDQILSHDRGYRERLDPVFGGRSLAVELLLSLLLCSNL